VDETESVPYKSVVRSTLTGGIPGMQCQRIRGPTKGREAGDACLLEVTQTRLLTKLTS
jgi:hypothetical protein